MADKFTGANGVDTHKPTWTDGLPHNFRGWGPQTPDPDASQADMDSMLPDDELKWRGDSDGPNHFVWRFDGRRPTYHH